MLDSCGLSVHNYDSTLIGWYNQSPPNNMELGAAGLAYCNGKSARDSLLAKGWIINGDILDCSSVSIIEESVQLQNITLYPNPSSGIVIIDFEKPFEGNVEVFNHNGQNLYQQIVNGVALEQVIYVS